MRNDYSDYKFEFKKLIAIHAMKEAVVEIDDDVVEEIVDKGPKFDKTILPECEKIKTSTMKKAVKQVMQDLLGEDFDFSVNCMRESVEEAVFSDPFKTLANLHVKMFDGKRVFKDRTRKLKEYIETDNTTLFSKRVSVFDVPIRKSEASAAISNTGLTMDIDAVKKFGNHVYSIDMPKDKDAESIGTYAHEVTHCLLTRHKNYTDNFTYNEVMSIIMEKIVLDKLKEMVPEKQKQAVEEAIVKQELIRYGDTKANFDLMRRDIEFYDKHKDYQRSIKDSKGVLHINARVGPLFAIDDEIVHPMGAMYADKVFKKYLSQDEIGKSQMLGRIREVFEGKRKVEEFLQDIECDKITVQDAKEYNARISRLQRAVQKKKDENEEIR